MGKKLRRYEKSSLLRCSAEKLFAFHLDSSNLEKITPEGMQVELLEDSAEVFEGKVIHLRVKRFFLTQKWEVKIERLDAPEVIVDNALKSPFGYFVHMHLFTPLDAEHCELRDRIHYKPPFGWFGSLFGFLIDREFEKMFSYRHEKTRELLEEK